jgi:hypothetical protein
MRRRPVDLDTSPVFLIEVVQVTTTALVAYASLAPGPGQAMRTLDAADIAKFKE